MPKIILIFYSSFFLSRLFLFLCLSHFPLFLTLLYHTFSDTTWRWASRTASELSPKLQADLSVMMPLDSVTMNNAVNRRKAMNVSLQALKSARMEEIMMGRVVGIGGQRGG